MTKSSTTKALAKARSAAPAKPTTEKTAVAPAAKKAAPVKTDRTFHATAMLAAQAAKEAPKSAVLRTPKGFYTGSKRAGVKAGAEFIGRVATVLPPKSKKQATAA